MQLLLANRQNLVFLLDLLKHIAKMHPTELEATISRARVQD